MAQGGEVGGAREGAGVRESGWPGARAEGQVDRGRHSGQREEPLHRKARGQEQVEQRLEGLLTQEVGHGEQ